MKGSLVRGIVTVGLVVSVATVGTIAVIQQPKEIKSKMIVSVESGDLDLALNANVNWASGTNSTFETESTASSFTNATWNMPNLVFSVGGENPVTSGILELVIQNNSASKTNIEIEGLAYDSEISTISNQRFYTFVNYKIGIGDYEVSTEKQITASQRKYVINDIASNSQVTIKIRYELNARNMNIINVLNNIQIKFIGGSLTDD